MKNKHIILMATLLASVGCYAQQLPYDTAAICGKLDNGLTYYIRHNSEPREQVNFYIVQRVGSVQEEEEQRGLAHFLEHMCFNGTRHFEGNNVIKYCESIGVKFGRNLNAYTSTDETVYNINDVPVTSDNIDSCLLILRDWSDGLLLLPEEIDKERGVIHEEWRMRTSPIMRILNRNLETLYPGSRYGRRMPIGLMSVVDNFQPETLRAYYKKWYRPDLQCIVVVGDVDAADVEKRLNNTFSSLVLPENPSKFEYYEVPDNNEPIYIIDSDKELKTNQIIICLKTDPLPRNLCNTPSFYSKNFIESIIAMVLQERFNDMAQDENCPFVIAECYFGKYLISGTKENLELDIVAKTGRTAEAVETVMKEVERVKRFGLTETEVSRMRQEFMSQVEKTFDNRDKQKNSYYVNKYVQQFLKNQPFPGIEMEYKIYNAINEHFTSQVCSQYFQSVTSRGDTNLVFLGCYPENEEKPTVEQVKQAVANARNAQLEAFVDNVKNEPLIDKLPKKGKIVKEEPAEFGYTLWTLSNGAKVYFRQTDFSNTEVLFSAQSFGGESAVGNDQITNLKMFRNVMNNTGLGKFDENDLTKALAGKQLGLSASLSYYTDNLSGSSTPKDLRTLFELIYLRFQTPHTDEKSFNNLITMRRAALENDSKSPMSAFNDSIYAVLYNRNKRTERLKISDLDNINYAEIREIHSQRFQSAGDFDFFFTGAVNPDSLRVYCEQYIASLPKIKKREPKPTKRLVDYFNGNITNKFERQMETPQAYMLIEWQGADTFNLKNSIVANAFGNIAYMRLLRSIRENAGFAYSVSADANVSHNIDNKDSFNMEFYCPFTPSKCDSVLMLFQQGLDSVANYGVTENELSDYKKFQLKQYANNLRNNNYWSGKMTTLKMSGLDLHTDFEKIINNITVADIQRFAKDKIMQSANRATIIMLPDNFEEKELTE